MNGNLNEIPEKIIGAAISVHREHAAGLRIHFPLRSSRALR
jgi:hypothetical protein